MYRPSVRRHRRWLHGYRFLSSEANQSSVKIDDNNKSEECDVAIVGGGMVGLALASALSNMPLTKQLKIAIIDSNPALGSKGYLKKDEIPDSRVSTVTPATISFFKDIGAWEHILRQRHAFFNKMQVWDYTGLGYTRYNAKDVEKEYLGCVVENKVLCNSLLLSLQSKEGFENMIYPTRMASLTLPSKGNYVNAHESKPSKSIKLDLTNGQTLQAKLVVGADGSKSRVRETAGIEASGWNYSQSAIICTVKLNTSSENNSAWQRFLPHGPIALLPIDSVYSNIVWTMSTDLSVRHLAMDSAEFVDSLNHALDHGYGSHPGNLGFLSGERFEIPPRVSEVVSERLGFELGLRHAERYVKNGVVLVGDSAHTVHPLAGQGVNLGFGDAEALARVLARGVSAGTEINEVNLLRRYERERKAVNIAMMAVLESIQKAYTIDFGPLNVLRAVAFHGANYISPLKKNIISYAMGDSKLPLFS